MNQNENEPIKVECAIISIIQGVKDGTRDPKSLTKDERQQCVEVCILEGYSVAQIAQLFSCSEKTVRRDVIDIRKRNALTPDIEFVKQVVGELYSRGVNHHGYLMRLARSKEASVSEKTQAEYAAWKVLKDVFEKLQSVGYVPLRSQALTGEVYHHIDVSSDKSFSDLKDAVIELEQEISESGDANPNFKAELDSLKADIEKAALTYKIEKLSEEQKKSLEDKEAHNE